MKEKKISVNRIIKKLISSILLVITLFMQTICFPVNVKANEGYEGIKTEVKTITSLNAGDTVTIKISTDGEAIQSIDAYFKYDFSIFEQLTETDIRFFESDWDIDSIEIDEEIHGENTAYIIMSNNKALSNTGDIAEITLTLKNDITETTVYMTDIYVVTEDFSSIKQTNELEVEIKKPKLYQITYEENTTEEVTGMPIDEEKTENIDYTIQGTPTRKGYIFKGWNTSADGNGTSYTVGSTYNINADLTLYAQWTGNIYTITFDPGQNGTVDPTTKQVIYGQTYGTLPIPTKPGYTFKKWKLDGTEITENDIVNITSDKTVTAEWEVSEYQLTFDYAGGTGDITDKIIKNEEQYGELPEANKEGHDFIGWYDQNGNKVESTDIVNVTSDITLTAQYKLKTYFITFKNDDGTEIKTIKVEHGTQATFTGDLPEKLGVADGYKATFTGWDNEEALQNVTQDLVLTATYEVSPIVYTITYYNLKEANNSSNPTTYTIEDEDFDLEGLEDQSKYLFIGWFTSNEENAEEVTSIDTSKLGNIVLYAKWLNDELYLSSEKYKVGENDIDNYEDGDIYLDKIEPETTVTELIANCDTNGIMTVIDEDGNVLEQDDLVGTGMTIKVTKDDEEITLIAIVMGDLNGDGKVTATDLSTLNQTIIDRKTLEEIRFKAADLDDNIKLTATDLSTINQTILDTIELTYNKNQENE